MMRTGAPFEYGESNGHDSGRDADIGAAGDHRLLGLAAALGVQDFKAQSMLFENPSALTDLGDGRIPVATLTGGDLECFLCLRHGRRGAERQQRHRAAEQPELAHSFLLEWLLCPNPAHASIECLRPANPGQATQCGVRSRDASSAASRTLLGRSNVACRRLALTRGRSHPFAATASSASPRGLSQFELLVGHAERGPLGRLRDDALERF